MSSAHAQPWRIAIVIGADVSLAAASEQLDELRSQLSRNSPNGSEIFVDSIDGLRFNLEKLLPAFSELMAQKYESQKVDIVIGIGDSVIEFLERYHEKIWPDVPVLVTSIPKRRLEQRKLLDGFTYIPFLLDINGTMRIIDALHPKLQRLIVVTGSTALDSYWMTRALDAIKQEFPPTLSVDVWSGLTQKELIAKAKSLEKGTAIVFTTMYRDRFQNSYLPFEVAGELSDASSVPVYSWYSTLLEQGITGGAIFDFRASARRAAAVAAGILSKTTAPALGLLPPDSTHCQMDASRFEQFNLNAENLPADCSFVHYPPSIWRDHKELVLSVLSVLIVQTSMIAALLWQRWRRRLAEQVALQRTGELIRATRIALVGEMGAAIAHEVGQPLGAIVTNSDAASLLLKRDPVDLIEIRHIVEDVRRDAMRASQILTNQRMLMHKQDLELVALAPDQAIEDTLVLLVPEARRRNCRLEMDLRCRNLQVMADRTQLQQVLLNLVINSMNALDGTAGDRHQISIATHAEGPWWVMAVSDNGPGIGPDVLPHIFDSFYTTRKSGTGLGLSIVRTIVTGLGGTVQASSVVGQGTIFEVRLPTLRQEAGNPGSA